MSKIFPIQNSSACSLKWGWNTFRMHTGTSSSCHRVKPEFVPIEQFDQFHNMPMVLADRALMRKGEWPNGRGCEYCKTVEDGGGISDRLYHNQLPDQAPLSFGESDYVVPSISEIYLENTCDLACVYCIPQFSSKINNELNTFGPNVIGLTPLPKLADGDRYFEKYLEWFDQHSHKLTRLSLMGGEPMLQKNLWVLLDFLKSKNNPNLEININSNLNSSKSTIERYVNTIKELILNKSIKRADIQASIDCWGPQQQFIRYGLDLDQFQNNFEYLTQHKWLRLSIHQVVTSLSIKTTNELQKHIASWKRINPRIGQEYFSVDGANYETLHSEIFGNRFFAKELENIANNFVCNNEYDNINKSRLVGIINVQANSNINHGRLQKLLLTLNQLDQRRNTSWRMLWPEIDEFFTEHKVYA